MSSPKDNADLTEYKQTGSLLKKFFKKDRINIKKINFFTEFKSPKICIYNAKLNAVIIPFLIVKNTPFVIVEKRSAYVKQPLELSFPGGRKEDDEKSALHTALREIEEEIGLGLSSFSRLKFCGVFANNKTVIYVFSALIKSSLIKKYDIKIELKNLNINKDEVEKVIFFPVAKLLSKPKEFEIVYNGKIDKMPESEKLRQIIQNGYIENGYYKPYNRIIHYWEYDNEILWGYSAEIMMQLIKDIFMGK